MPAYRQVPAVRGAAWITDGLLGLRRAPGPFLGACLIVAVLRSLPLLGVLMGMLMPVFYAGLASLLRTRSEGGTGRANQAYDGFVAPGAFARLLPLVAFNIVFLLAVGAVLALAVGPEFSAVLASAGTGGEVPPAQVEALAAKLAIPLLALLPVAVFVGWLMMLAIPRAMLDGVRGTTALREAAAAVWINVGAFVVNLACLVLLLGAGLFASALGLVLVAAVTAAVPALAGVARIVSVFVMIAAFHAIYAAVLYQAARDVFPVAEAAPPVLDAIEA